MAEQIRFIGPYGTLCIPARLFPQDAAQAAGFVAAIREEILKPLRTPDPDADLRWVERNWWLLSAGDVPRPSGPERVLEAIRRDRGAYAPSGPVTLCGTPDGTEVRADSQPDPPGIPLRLRLGEWLACTLQCPACLGLRFGPTHLGRLLLIGKH